MFLAELRVTDLTAANPVADCGVMR